MARGDPDDLVETLVRRADVVVTCSVPRLDPGDLAVHVLGQTLRVRVARREEIEVPLPVPVDAQSLRASCVAGVLEVTLLRAGLAVAGAAPASAG